MRTTPAAVAGMPPLGANAARTAGVRRRRVGAIADHHRRHRGAGMVTAIIAMTGAKTAAGAETGGAAARVTGKVHIIAKQKTPPLSAAVFL